MSQQISQDPKLIYDRISTNFAKQSMLTTIGARLELAELGRCVITAPIGEAFRQHHGFAHAGFTFTLGDTAAGYAALSHMREGAEVVSVEVKMNMLAPAVGDYLVATGSVLRAGRQIVAVRAEVEAVTGDQRKLVAALQGTMMPVEIS
ncbi:MAG: PaaI family thioesterase [Mangrovicoccus sp.]